MATCPNCGCFSYGEASFCVQCGTQLPRHTAGVGVAAARELYPPGFVNVHGRPVPKSVQGAKKTLPGTVITAKQNGEIMQASSSELSSETTPEPGDDPREQSGTVVLPEAVRDQAIRDQALRDQALLDEVLRDEDIFSAEVPLDGATQPESTDASARGRPVLYAEVWDEAPRSPQPSGESSDSTSSKAPTGALAGESPVVDPSPTPARASEVDHADFGRMTPVPDSNGASEAASVAEVRELFAQLAAEQMRPVRDFILELKLGAPPREWLDVVTPVVATLRKAAERMDLIDLCRELDQLTGVLEVVSTEEKATIGAEAKAGILEAYSRLAELMPSVFHLDLEGSRREPIIVQSLLRQVPGVRKVALDRLYAAGLTSLEMYRIAKPQDITETAGIVPELAAAIVEHFARYLMDVAQVSPGSGLTDELAKLRRIVERLEAQNSRFEAVGRDFTPQAKQLKRALRQERGETVLELNVLLARLGEVDLIANLERLPFAGKVVELERYLVHAKDTGAGRARAPGGATGRR